MTKTKAAKQLNNPGTKPELSWRKPSELFVDHRYQRTTGSTNSKANIRQMVEYWSWACCGALIVGFVPSKKKFAVIDGQHRLEAAIQRGDIEYLPCLVISAEEMKVQAKSFQSINNKRLQLTVMAKYYAALAAEDVDEVHLQKLLDSCKISITTTPAARGQTEPRETSAIGTLLRMQKEYNEKQIKWALTIIPEAYGDRKGMLRAQLIKALAEFIKRNPAADRQIMIQTLQGGGTTRPARSRLPRLRKSPGRHRPHLRRRSPRATLQTS